jgi:hypothetical protein
MISSLTCAALLQVFEEEEECDNDPTYSTLCHPPDHYYWRWIRFSMGLLLGMEPRSTPITVPGQITEIVFACLGSVLLAVLIALVSNALELTVTESRVVDRLWEDYIDKTRKTVALKYIQACWRDAALRRTLQNKANPEEASRRATRHRAKMKRNVRQALQSWKRQKNTNFAEDIGYKGDV